MAECLQDILKERSEKKIHYDALEKALIALRNEIRVLDRQAQAIDRNIEPLVSRRGPNKGGELGGINRIASLREIMRSASGPMTSDRVTEIFVRKHKLKMAGYTYAELRKMLSAGLAILKMQGEVTNRKTHRSYVWEWNPTTG